MSAFLLEIGAENIPASYLAPATHQLGEDARAMLARTRLAHGDITTASTPRRIVLVVKDLAAKQEAGEEVVTGPPVSRAFTPLGEPTPAAAGFARSQGVAVGDLDRIQTPKGEYLGVRKRLDRRAAAAVLSDEVPALMAGLRFPRTMKWEESGARFARPVRWIVALLGNRVVNVTFAGVRGGRVTHRRPWMRGESRSVASVSDYAARMRSLGVLLDPEARRARLGELARDAAAARGLRVVPDDGLIDELTFMVEDPRLLLGSFDRVFLDLPAEVVVTAMRAHQRYIALTDRHGALSPHFITFTDGPVKGPADVVLGNERVLRARLADARFYWQEDLKRGVDGLADELDRIVFIEGLGTVGEKWRRMLELARAIDARSDGKARVATDLLARAARLCKADLASSMIRDGKEFTALQGVIGARYALACGEPPAVAAAIREHYQPRAGSDPLPESAAGRLLAAADRADTLAGCFLAGFKPSGSQDPYALRRHGNGLVRLAAEMPEIVLDAVLDEAAAGYTKTLGAAEVDARWDGKRAGAELHDFVRGRVEAFLRDAGIAFDVAAAVLPVAWVRPGVALERARAIAALRGDTAFERLITGVRRVANILPGERRRVGASWDDVRRGVSGEGAFPFDAARFEDPAETALLDAVRAELDAIERSEAAGDLTRVLTSLSGLANPIDAYFDRVLVNAPDPALRDTRLGFLAAIYGLFGRYADFHAIVEAGSDPR